MFVTPGSFCPLGRMMVQWSSKAKVAASQKVARTNSMIGEWAVATGDPPKESAAKQLDTSSTMWNFVGGSKAPRAALWRTQSGTNTAVVNALAKAGIDLARMGLSSQGRRGRRVRAADLLRYRAKFLTVAWRSVLLPADALDLPPLHPIHGTVLL
jgi:hypothetical protein